jgi:SAM-dependent methyltransferase
MSRQLLKSLNGNRNGQLQKFLDDFNGEPRIAWYPSAGADFRALLYLHPNFSRQYPATEQEPNSPDIFLFTDYYPWQYSSFLDNGIIYSDTRTTVFIDHIEELPRLNLPLHRELVHFPEGSNATDRTIFLKITITSDKLGQISYPVIYAFAENETFFCQKLIPNKAIISHIIHVRYGGGCGGGGNASGVWLLNVLNLLNCELLISDGHYYWQSGDNFALELCPSIPKESEAQLTPIRIVQSEGWSGHGDVSWNVVKYNSSKANGLSGEETIETIMNVPHNNSAKYFDFVFARRFGPMYNVLTQNNLSKIKTILANGKILDFGAGTGRISIPLAKDGYNVTAVDCSSEMLEELRRKAKDLNLNIETHLTLTDVQMEDFDLAISIFTVLAYINSESELTEVFQNIFRCLKPGGMFMFDLERRAGYDQICRINNGIVHDRAEDLVTVNFQNNDPSLCNYYEEVKGTLPSGEVFDYTESFVIKFWTIDEVRLIFRQIGFTEIEHFEFANADYFIIQKN